VAGDVLDTPPVTAALLNESLFREGAEARLPPAAAVAAALHKLAPNAAVEEAACAAYAAGAGTAKDGPSKGLSSVLRRLKLVLVAKYVL
jgi:hypothetical protein